MGTGQHVSELKYSSFEKHPDTENHPNIARMKIKGIRLVVPDDAPQEEKDLVGRYFTHMHYFDVDRDYKLLQEIGATEVPDETTDTAFYGIEYGKLTTVGEWSYHANESESNIQAKLNSDNSVLAGVNFKAPAVKETGDITKNIAFYFAEPQSVRRENVCPDFLPIKESPTSAKLDKLGHYFEADDDAFRKPNDDSKHVVTYAAKFGAILQVESVFERFGAKLSVTLSWDITKLDIVDFVASNDSPTWRPAWSPPSFTIVNPATGREDNLQIGSGRIKVKSVKDSKTGKDKFIASLTIEMSGEFYEAFELQNYPFDVQPLTIELEAIKSTADDAEFVAAAPPILPNEVRDTEWYGRGSTSSVEYNDEGRYYLKIAAVVERYSSVHMFRVVAVLASISLTSVTAMCKDPEVTCLERIGLTVTLMLTATAYSLVIASSIPTLGYLTLLDKYILATFGYIVAVTAAVVGLEWADIEDADSTPQYGLIGSAALWFFMHLVFAAYIMCSVVPAEAKKGDELEAAGAKGKKPTATEALYN